jgi:hypothetical protein
VRLRLAELLTATMEVELALKNVDIPGVENASEWIRKNNLQPLESSVSGDDVDKKKRGRDDSEVASS